MLCIHKPTSLVDKGRVVPAASKYCISDAIFLVLKKTCDIDY